MNRRAFIMSSCAAGALAAVPVSVLAALPAQPRDEYGEFLQRVAARIRVIVEREQRGVRRMWIDPPRVVGNGYTRKVHIMLEAGSSLLDTLHFEFEEYAGSRWHG